MNIEKLNDLQKCLEILLMDDFYSNKETFEVILKSTIYDILSPLLDSMKEECDSEDKLFKFLVKLDRNLKAIIMVRLQFVKEDNTLYENRHKIQQWIKYYEDKLKEILKEYE